MTDNEKKILFGFGLLGAGVLLFMSRKKLSDLATSALDETNDLLFRATLSTNAKPYADVVRQVAREQGRDPLLLAALVDREDPWWDPNIVSADGGHGLGQITSDLAWIESAAWWDPYTNLTKAAEMLGVELDFFNSKFPDDPVLAAQYALAAYNRGRTRVWAGAQRGELPDTGTTNNYATGVWSIYDRLAGTFQVGLGQV